MVKIVKVVENKIKYFSKIFWAAPFWRVGRERGNKLFIPPGLIDVVHQELQTSSHPPPTDEFTSVNETSLGLHLH